MSDRKKRTVVIDFYSHVPENLWSDALREIDECVQQIACDYAIAAPADDYTVYIEDVTPRDADT